MKTIKLTFKVIWHFEKLLDKNANTRLGSPSSPHGEIIENPFFHEIDWKKLERRQLESPFKPEIVRKTSFFSFRTWDKKASLYFTSPICS